nr:hypothetical protein 3 [bacterium]
MTNDEQDFNNIVDEVMKEQQEPHKCYDVHRIPDEQYFPTGVRNHTVSATAIANYMKRHARLTKYGMPVIDLRLTN